MVEVIVSDATSFMVLIHAINCGIYKRFFYNFQRASIWASPALLPFSQRYRVDPKPLSKRLLGKPEFSANSTQFVCKRYRSWEWVIAEKLENSRKISDLRLDQVVLPTKQRGFIRPELVRDLPLEESQRQPPALDMIAESFQYFRIVNQLSAGF